MPKSRLTVDKLRWLLPEPQRSACLSLLEHEGAWIEPAPGSTHNHQAWAGGYLDHVSECMNIALQLYGLYDSLRPLPFSLQDALLVLFLHDLEKPWFIYREGSYYARAVKDKQANHGFRKRLCLQYGIELTPEQENALRYVEGENTDYTPGERSMGPLAAFCHCCDITSARLWFDYPQKDDAWPGE
jgi:hypothetical protein